MYIYFTYEQLKNRLPIGTKVKYMDWTPKKGYHWTDKIVTDRQDIGLGLSDSMESNSRLPFKWNSFTLLVDGHILVWASEANVVDAVILT